MALIDDEYRRGTEKQVETLLRNTPYHSLQLPDGTVLPGLISLEALKQRITAFPIPEDLRGLRVLDVGAASGWNSFEMLRRGASVTAIDCVPFEEFISIRDRFSPQVRYEILDVDELTPSAVGTFDLVLFLGVLYHLRHPLLALERICALTTQMAFVESFVSDPIDRVSEDCSLDFYEIDELGGQLDNWFGPTAKCLQALCRSAGFVRVRLEYISQRRAGVTCHRRWEAEPKISCPAPVWLYSAVNNRTNDIYFHLHKDEYLCIYFRSFETNLDRERIRIEIDGYGVNALSVVSRAMDEWQANSRMPSGLSLGEHTVRIRTTTTRFGNTFTVYVVDSPGLDPAPVAPPMLEHLPSSKRAAPVIFAIENNLDRSAVFHGYSSERLCCRFRYSDQNLSRERVVALIDADTRFQQVSFLTDLANGEWQANLSLPVTIAAGTHTLRLRAIDSYWSDPVQFFFERESSI